MSDAAVRFHDKYLADQPQHRNEFSGPVETYWAALYETVCRASGIRTPFEDFDLVTSDLFTVEEMASNPIALRFMDFVLRLGGYRRVLEIGTFVGVSAMYMARALPAGGEVVTIEKFDKFAKVARENFRRNGFDGRITLLEGDAHAIIPGLPANPPFDFAFIDGDKERYFEYFEMCDRLVRPGGLIVVDDVFFHGDAINAKPKTPKGAGVRRFLDKMEGLSGYRRLALPLSNGTMLLLKDGRST